MADPRVIAFMNEEVRPLAQEVRSLKAASATTMAQCSLRLDVTFEA